MSCLWTVHIVCILLASITGKRIQSVKLPAAVGLKDSPWDLTWHVACAERGRTHCQWHTEIQSRSDLMHNELHCLTFRIELSTSWVCWCNDVSTTKHLGTWWTTARQSLTSFSDSVCVRPAVTNFPCRVIGSAPTAVGHFLLPDQLSGTHCLMTYVIRNVLETFSDSR